MDPDAEAEQAASPYTLISTTFFTTVVFTACHTYTADDTLSAGNIGDSLPDTVHKVAMKPAPKKKKKTIYLTFDDGPNKGTAKLKDIIEEEQVPVTLFVVGQHVYGSKAQSEIYDSLASSKWFEIANHSFTHAFGNQFSHFYAVPDSAVKDFLRCADSLGLKTNIIRTPGRNIWRMAGISSTDIKTSTAAADSLQQRFTIMGWDLEWHFDQQLKLQCSDDELLHQIDSLIVNGRTKTPGHLVLLAHDQVYADSANSFSLHRLIRKLKATDEYDFETVSQYPGIRN